MNEKTTTTTESTFIQNTHMVCTDESDERKEGLCGKTFYGDELGTCLMQMTLFTWALI